MNVSLYDTHSRSLRSLEPIDGKTFRFYCCGPTVYSPAHIGNFRTFILQDVLRRVLETTGTPTKHVRNITDIDDKTIRDSQKAGIPLRDFTRQWTERFHKDCALLNLLPPHIEPSAVEHIPEQIAMAEKLVERGHAYRANDGSLYFKINSFPAYGQLAHLDEQELQPGKSQNQRATADEYEKDSIADFALWKAWKEEDGENYWESPWGKGRPGWHLECSVMSHAYLGDTFDLHSGGVDLIFPHHENEIAQSLCSVGGEFAHHWFHINHLMVDGGKMSKSLGNLHTLENLAELGHHPREVRYTLISGHYRRPLNFTLRSLDDSRAALERIARTDAWLAEYSNSPTTPPTPEQFHNTPEAPFTNAWDSLRNDLNTPEALGHLFTTLRQIRTTTPSPDSAAQTRLSLHKLLYALGLSLPPLQETIDKNIPNEIADLAAKRWKAKENQDWTTADNLRDEIKKQGWIVKDTKDGYLLEPTNPSPNV